MEKRKTRMELNIIRHLQKWMDSVAGQTFLNYAYSWGAAIVILGTLFKLTHLPGANSILFLGMGTEVLVFFISAFDRPFDKAAEGMALAATYPAAEGGGREETEEKQKVVFTDDDELLRRKKEELLRAYDTQLQKVNAYNSTMEDATELVMQIAGQMKTASRVGKAMKKVVLDELDGMRL